MANGLDKKSFQGYDANASAVSMRMLGRYPSTTDLRGSDAASETREQQEKADRQALLSWLKSIIELLEVWTQHLAAVSYRPIEPAEIEALCGRLLRIKDDLTKYLYSEDSLLATLGYAERVAAWEAELATPWAAMMRVLYPYRNALRKTDLVRSGDRA